MNTKESTIERIETKTAIIAIIGLGYVGLPLAIGFAKNGFRTIGIDQDQEKVVTINRGVSYIEDVDAEIVAALVSDTGKLKATTDYSFLAGCDAVVICVPTPLSRFGNPDISCIISATQEVARYLHPGMLIALESSTYPGTTTEVVLPILEETKNLIRDEITLSGNHAKYHSRSCKGSYTVGIDFFLAYSPERIDPGRKDWTTNNIPKVIGGVTPTCLEVATALYESMIETVKPVHSPNTAEMVKLVENTFRWVNIALVNELLMMCDKEGLDAWEVLEAAATKPFGFMKFEPGPGIGGHCIPIDPKYLSWKLEDAHNYSPRLIQSADEINASMPSFWVQKIQTALNRDGKMVRDSRILVLGVAYKKDVSDLRESPALHIIRLLQAKGANVHYIDPYIPRISYEELQMTSKDDLVQELRYADCTVVVTDHSSFDWQTIVKHAVQLVDTRHVIHSVQKSLVTEQGKRIPVWL